MAFSARRSLATALSRHFSRRLHPSASHLLSPHHDHRESESPSSSPTTASTSVPVHTQPSPFPSAFPRPPARSRALGLPLPFALHLAAHRSFSTSSSSSPSAPDTDVAAGEFLSDAASSVSAMPTTYAGEVAAAAAESFPPVAALQYLMDAVQSFTGLNWWACIALTTVLIRLVTVPMLVNQMKATVKLNAMRPEIEAINEEMQNSTDPRSMEVGKEKLGKLFLRHDVTPLTPFKGLFIQGPIFLSFFFAISNMVEKVPSMKVGGAYWFTDLTTPDDLFILPVLTSLTFLATVELNMQDGMEGNPMAKTMKTFSRVFGLLFIPSTLIFPKAIFFYWVTANLFSLVYGAEDGRNGTFMIGNESFPASLLDLPAVVESYKTYDDSVLIKTADIGQMIMVREENDPAPEGVEYKHGLTPPMRDARRRRFRREPDLNAELVSQVEKHLINIMHGVSVNQNASVIGGEDGGDRKKAAVARATKPEVPGPAANGEEAEPERSDSDESVDPEN